jgi:hypothetical protein
MKRNPLWSLILTLSCLVSARGDILVLPEGRAHLEGNGALDSPFETRSSELGRAAQIFERSLFDSLPGPISISQIAFRLDGRPQPPVVDVTIPALEVQLSTTQWSADRPEQFNVFDVLHGEDRTIVFSKQPLRWFTTPQPEGALNPFDLIIPFSQPFEYDPTKGNLYIDLKVFGVSTFPLLDAHRGGEPRTVYGFYRTLGSHQDIAEAIYDAALVTELTFVVIPEPDSVAMWLLGMILLIAFCPMRRALDG